MSDSTELLQNTMHALTKLFPKCGIVLLITPLDGGTGLIVDKPDHVAYVSNTQRPETTTMLKEMVARFEGRAHDAHKSVQ